MPKLKLDKSFTDKLNSINKGKIGKSKSNGNIAGTVSRSRQRGSNRATDAMASRSPLLQHCGKSSFELLGPY